MLERIIAQSIRFRWLVLAIVLVSAAVGVFAEGSPGKVRQRV